MTIPLDLERRLAEFVDRDSEMERFRELLKLGPNDKRLLVITGDGGIGKSSLMARMIHECSLEKRRKALIIWTDTRNHDYLAVMRALRDDVGPESFSAFTDLANFFTVPRYELNVHVSGGSGTVGQGMSVDSSSTVGDMALVLIKDSMFTFPRTDMAVPETERIVRLTDAFTEGLQVAVETEPLVVFFDAIEKMSEVTEKWMWGELIEVVRSGRLPNTIFVLFGRRTAQLGRDWHSIAEAAELQPLGLPDTIKYLERRGLPDEERLTLARAWLAVTQGTILPLQLATFVDGYLASQDAPPRKP